MSDGPTFVSVDPERFGRVVILLRTRDAFLPEPLRRVETLSGFDNRPHERACPDCLANGRVLMTCETCEGRGRVSIDQVAVADERPNEWPATLDPYQKNEPRLYGLTGERHDRSVAIDGAIVEAEHELRRLGVGRPLTEADALAETPELPWERDRRKLYRNGDYRRLDAALEQLHVAHPDVYHAVHAVYVYGYQVKPPATLRRVAELGVAFLEQRMRRYGKNGKLLPIRVPSQFLPETDTQTEQIRRRTERGKAA